MEHQNAIVSTACGKVLGLSSQGLLEFRAVPYAEPPIGELRWKPPVPVRPWEGVRDCRERGVMPVQHLTGADVEPYRSDFYYEPLPSMGEDCLYLNITVDENAPGSKADRPVFVWFHGGGLTTCHTYEPEADGRAFAEKGIVFVSVEQRLGIFGYLSLPQLTAEQGTSGNYGLLDQICALEWIRDNIAAFGGDPSNITIGGQSGGTVKCMSMVLSPKFSVPVRRIILQSGLQWDRPFPSLSEAEQNGLARLSRLGLAQDASLDELRALPAESLLELPEGNPYIDFVTCDGIVLKDASARDGLLRGACREIPILCGCNLGEGEYTTPAGKDAFYADFRERLGDLYDTYSFETLVPANDSTAPALARRLAAYGLSNLCWTNIMLPRLYGEWSRKALHSDVKNYVYLFAHRTPSRPCELGTERDEEIQWSWHSSELWYTFRSLREGTPPARRWTAWDYALAEQINTYWANFIRTGDPNGEGLPYWPSSSDDLGYVLLGDGISGETRCGSPLESLMEDYVRRQFGLPPVSGE